MIGGTVIETMVLPDKVWINTRDKCSTSECAIYVELTDKSKCVSDGDTVWWQSTKAYWTPSFYKQKSGKEGRDFDIQLKRIGFSGVSRPALAKGDV
jgi:hypothetical protein